MTTNHLSNPARLGSTLRIGLNLVAFAAVLVINSLATSGRIGGTDTGELSDAYPSLFTPAGYVFSIWGLIYSLLIIFVIYQALPAQWNNVRLERLGLIFVWSCLLNCGWIFAWHYQQISLSWLLMLGMLVTLIFCYERLEIGKSRLKRTEAVALQLPFRIYLGWITVATVANTAILLLELGFSGGRLAAPLTVLVLAVATGIGYLVLLRRADVAFALVLVWAFAGIAVKQWGAEPLVVAGALLGAVSLLIAIIPTVRFRRRMGTMT
ncbi:MAG: tryptophan-rich sensory protein [Trueperaceae bacterium]|nr:MAG: tryptophan-rich sensory protein [Trueperaceae bacterium]